ncbi:hypothetical protein FJTKL_00922 [Diaporthe vaccinii]|uniref:Retrotransposon gag domain-containing protein n=1 Tax=Diaporthe vaccinii TaxID=105482 RepID=A0ABR4E1V1_9PEZI
MERSEIARSTYVARRLTKEAYELILPKTLYGVPQFVDYPDLLKYLEEAFGDPDRIQNSRNKLYQLRQRNQDFSAYFAEFQRLALEGEMLDTALSPSPRSRSELREAALVVTKMGPGR